MGAGVISSAVQNNDLDRLLDLGSFLAIDSNVKEAAADLAKRQKAAEEAEAKANAAIKKSQAAAKEAETAIAEAKNLADKIAADHEKLVADRTSFEESKSILTAELEKDRADFDTQARADATNFVSRVDEFEKSIKVREADLRSKEESVNSVAAELASREKAVKEAEQRNQAERDRINEWLAEVKKKSPI